MSLESARQAAYSLLTACGPWSGSEVSSCDFGIPAQVSACAIVFHPDGDSLITPLTFGGNGNIGSQSLVWGFRGNGFIVWKSDPELFLGQLYTMIDDIQSTFAKSWKGTGNAGASMLRLTRINCNIDEVYELQGRDYGLIQFYFQEEEIDSP